MKVKWKQFGRAVTQARVAIKLDQRQLAKKLRIHYSTICRVEQGRTGCSIETFLTLCSFMGTNPYWYVK